MARLPPLKCFEAAARGNSFSKAADELHVTQSAVSHQIRQLEEWFGVALFDRQGRQTLPTPEGVEFAAPMARPLGLSGRPASALPKATARPRSPLPPFPPSQQSGSYRACPPSCASTLRSTSVSCMRSMINRSILRMWTWPFPMATGMMPRRMPPSFLKGFQFQCAIRPISAKWGPLKGLPIS